MLTSMKTFKDRSAFKKRVEKTTAWADYFKLDGRMYVIYEYGDAYPQHSYVYFINKRTHDAIKVEYHLPTQTGNYACYSVEFIPNMPLWR